MADPRKQTAQIIAHAWADEQFLNDLVAAGDDRKAIETVLARKDLKMPGNLGDDVKVRFVANNVPPGARYIVIPERPKFTDDDMCLIIALRQWCDECCSCDFFKEGLVEKLDDIVHKILGGG